MATRPTTPPLRRSPVNPIDDDNDEDSPLSSVPDTDDHTYSPQCEQTLKRAKVAKLTPAKRRKTGSSVATYARENAIEASRVSRSFFSSSSVLLNHYLGPIPCLISGKQLLTDCVETCHVIPRAVDHATVRSKLPRYVFISDTLQLQLDKLEYLWGFKYFTFHVDTRSNLIHRMLVIPGCFVAHACPTTVNASLHGAFDRQGWFLIPTEVRLVEDLDRATLASPPQHLLHEVSRLLSIFSQSVHLNSSQATCSEIGLPVSLQLCASSPNGGKLVKHIHRQLFHCALLQRYYFTLFPFCGASDNPFPRPPPLRHLQSWSKASTFFRRRSRGYEVWIRYICRQTGQQCLAGHDKTML